MTGSATARCSTSGVWRGENNRPLNAVTSRSPALQPACARRDIAWKAFPEARSRACLAGGACHAEALWSGGGAKAGACRQRLDRVGVAVDLVPDRHQRSRLREQQKQDAIHDRQRLLERDGAIGGLSRRPRQRHRQGGQCRQHAVAERSADARRMRVRFEEVVSKRRRGRAGESGGARKCPERRDAFRSGHERVEIELDRRARPRSSAIDDADRAAVADDQPTSLARRARALPRGATRATPAPTREW